MKNVTLYVGGLMLAFAAGCGGPDAKAPDGTPAATTGGSSSSGSSAAAGPGDLSDLETKRMVDNISGDIPKHKAKFKELCGSDVNVDVDWASFGHDKAALDAFWSNYGVERLVASFADVCKDKTGKDA